MNQLHKKFSRIIKNKKTKNIVLYIRHISFILFLVSLTYLYPSFNRYELGKMCQVVSFIYIIITFIMFMIKNKGEQQNVLNNFVLIVLHLYFCLLAYKFQLISSYLVVDANSYFKFNFIILSFCMTILTINKLILTKE